LPVNPTPADTTAPHQLTDAQQLVLRARLAHHRANPGEHGVTMHELKARLLGAGNTRQAPP